MASMKSEAPEEQRAFYKSTAWQRCRSAYISYRGGLCERCMANGVATPGYIVHHKEYITMETLSDPEIALSFNNLELLCLDCHNKEHFKRKRRFVVGPGGVVSPLCTHI